MPRPRSEFPEELRPGYCLLLLTLRGYGFGPERINITGSWTEAGGRQRPGLVSGFFTLPRRAAGPVILEPV